MKKQAMVIGAVLAAGVAVAAVIVNMPTSNEVPGEAVSTGFDASASLEQRVQALEAALSTEREARQLLEDEVFALYDVIDRLEAGVDIDSDADVTDTGLAGAVGASGVSGDRRRYTRSLRRDDTEGRRTALTEAGFSPDRVDWIVQRESELRMEAMRMRFDQMRRGEPLDPGPRFATPDSLLRDEIGDAEYEMYLDATNRPTSVNVGQVLASSPAQSAGLQPGDRITHYDGERVFSTFDLTRQALEGDAGENVVVNIVRDGMPMQVVMPRGPLGISTRRGR